ncbi:MAG: hypothetical protein CYPHOPRED_003817 [Cyphobasidiales sp. Tagirdzhanova-0007]|nr:MAG: hypothetical protein CYPHOPRED_003817 [Cyphobasidiales sp. Tagirdzhanova-0007]
MVLSRRFLTIYDQAMAEMVDLLRKIRQRLPHEEGSLHLLGIHRLITPVKWTVNPAPESRPNNGGKDCILCGDALEDTAHVFIHCRFAHTVWAKIMPSTRQLTHLDSLLTYRNRDREILGLLPCYVDGIWHLASKRRLQRGPLKDLGDEDAQTLAKELKRGSRSLLGSEWQRHP